VKARTLAGCGIRRLDLECCPGFAIFVLRESWGCSRCALEIPFPAQPAQLGVGLRSLHRQISQAD